MGNFKLLDNTDMLNKAYPIKVWLLTALGGQYLGVILVIVFGYLDVDPGMLYFPFLIGLHGMFLSLPLFVIYYILLSRFVTRINNPHQLKLISCLYVLVSIFLVYLAGDRDVLQTLYRKSVLLYFLGPVICGTLTSVYFEMRDVRAINN